jgi:hypothetical protein
MMMAASLAAAWTALAFRSHSPISGSAESISSSSTRSIA